MIQGEVNNGLTCNTVLYAQSVKGLCIKYTLHACKTCLPCLNFSVLGSYICYNPKEMSKNKLCPSECHKQVLCHNTEMNQAVTISLVSFINLYHHNTLKSIRYAD